eukprot:4466863-Pleurochrysis_carterae.AAC.3
MSSAASGTQSHGNALPQPGVKCTDVLCGVCAVVCPRAGNLRYALQECAQIACAPAAACTAIDDESLRKHQCFR